MMTAVMGFTWPTSCVVGSLSSCLKYFSASSLYCSSPAAARRARRGGEAVCANQGASQAQQDLGGGQPKQRALDASLPAATRHTHSSSSRTGGLVEHGSAKGEVVKVALGLVEVGVHLQQRRGGRAEGE